MPRTFDALTETDLRLHAPNSIRLTEALAELDSERAAHLQTKEKLELSLNAHSLAAELYPHLDSCICQRCKLLREHDGCCGHDSDCAVHNAPALPVGACDCTRGLLTNVDALRSWLAETVQAAEKLAEALQALIPIAWDEKRSRTAATKNARAALAQYAALRSGK